MPRGRDEQSPERFERGVVGAPTERRRLTEPEAREPEQCVEDAAVWGEPFIGDQLLELGPREDGTLRAS